jgi:hypothetical protein
LPCRSGRRCSRCCLTAQPMSPSTQCAGALQMLSLPQHARACRPGSGPTC